MSMDNGSVLLKSPITMDPSPPVLRNLNVSGQSSLSSSSVSSSSSSSSSSTSSSPSSASSSSSIIPACRRQLLASDSPGMCRRVATFPLASRGVFVKPSVLKGRSLSESEKINLVLAREGKIEIDDWQRRCAELMAASSLAPLAENINQNNNDKSGSNKSNINNCNNDNNNNKKKKKKKKVTFADCQGHQLATVKVMTEPSDVPPRLSASILRAHGIPVSEDDEEDKVDAGKPGVQNPASWHLGFTQPASQYAAFRRKTNEQQVALENVMLDDHCTKLTGTVKVKNISFEKTVLIRYTTDNWQSYYDKQATFQRSAGDLDTFQFQFNMPTNESASVHHPHDTVQFCVCYRTGDGREFWDNNQGSNFEVFNEQVRQRRNTQTLSTSASASLSSSSFSSSSTSADANSANNNHNNNNNNNNNNNTSSSVDANNPSTLNQLNNSNSQNNKNYSTDSDNVDGTKHSDAFLLNMSHWGEFASWQHLCDDRPYCTVSVAKAGDSPAQGRT